MLKLNLVENANEMGLDDFCFNSAAYPYPNWASVVVNSMCQLDWVMGYPGMWSSIILPASIRGVFWMRLAFKWADGVKQMVLSDVGGPHLICWRPEENKKTDPSPK